MRASEALILVPCRRPTTQRVEPVRPATSCPSAARRGDSAVAQALSGRPEPVQVAADPGDVQVADWLSGFLRDLLSVPGQVAGSGPGCCFGDRDAVEERRPSEGGFGSEAVHPDISVANPMDV